MKRRVDLFCGESFDEKAGAVATEDDASELSCAGLLALNSIPKEWL